MKVNMNLTNCPTVFCRYIYPINHWCTHLAAMLGGMCGPLLKLNYMQLWYNNHNAVKLVLIGSSDRDASPEQEELVSPHAK